MGVVLGRAGPEGLAEDGLDAGGTAGRAPAAGVPATAGSAVRILTARTVTTRASAARPLGAPAPADTSEGVRSVDFMGAGARICP